MTASLNALLTGFLARLQRPNRCAGKRDGMSSRINRNLVGPSADRLSVDSIKRGRNIHSEHGMKEEAFESAEIVAWLPPGFSLTPPAFRVANADMLIAAANVLKVSIRYATSILPFA
jgi:hypothetical protein